MRLQDFKEKLQEATRNKNSNYGFGNIDLNNRKVLVNNDGSISTERSMSFYDNNERKEILIPTIINGKQVSNNEAIKDYYVNGKFLGKFDDVEDANIYAKQLHERQQDYYTLPTTLSEALNKSLKYRRE